MMTTPFETYKYELGKDVYDPISDREVEHSLLWQYKNTGDMIAFNRLVRSNMRFVVFVLKEFNIPPNVEIMDIIQEGNFGLIIGIKRFNVEKYPEIKLFSYVVHWIRFYIRIALSKNRAYEKKRAFLPLDDYLESSMHYTRDDVDSGVFLTPDALHADDLAAEDIQTFLLQHLDQREVAILRLYYILGDTNNEIQTLESIGQQLHIKFVRVRQIRDKAVERLRALAASGEMEKYF
jgi:RNA polymerase sigma factor (sigma-70 family)